MDDLILFISENIFECLTAFISVTSLMISFITLWSNRKILDVSIEEPLTDEFDSIYLTDQEYQNDKPTYKFGKPYKICYIKVVNPSPTDIPFFDFQILDLTNHKLVAFLVKGNVGLSKSDDNTVFYKHPPTGMAGRLNLLDSNYGIFKSNTFTRYEIPIDVPKNCKTLNVSFKIAKTSIFSRPGSKFRKHFKYYSTTYKISDNGND